MMKKIALILLLLTACTDNKTAARILVNDGFSNIKLTGYNWFACGQGDYYSTGFVGVKNGRVIKGTVCSGLIFKNATIRYE